MAKLRISPSAASELIDILEFITLQSGDRMVGAEFVATLRRKCRTLAALPGQMGRLRPELGHGIRSFAYHGYIIIFRYIDNVFEVLHILEGHRDIDAHLNDRH
ncbi:type II toxin-antitoxin system RelE/ParE family toxin [Rhizobium sp. CF142]|uniref:type II toxin-antitoxin system RelE/ParE family toxin n=1 Tax=Rhizobium sp. CF142 TaxID=1144314 RepID=UPI000311F577|nr:type II toxin-antitoxin system RelE/ParE family toxin [Rhizobium sp. CF142]